MRKVNLRNSFSDEVYLITGLSEEGFHSYIKRLFPTYTGWVPGVAQGRMEDPEDKNGVKYYLIWLDTGLSDKEKRLVLIHECIHIVTSLFKECGVPLTWENDETFAYVHGDLVYQVFRWLKL